MKSLESRSNDRLMEEERARKFTEILQNSLTATGEDLERIKKELNLAPTPKEPVFSENSVTLYRYVPVRKQLQGTPLLIVPSLILRYHIMDLLKGHSLIEDLVNKGIDTYLIDWGVPGEGHGHLTFDYYIGTFMRRCVRKVSRLTGRKQINLLGQCIGGTLGAIYTALYPDQINRFVALTTPVDFEDAGLLAFWTKKEFFDVDAVVDSFGSVVPAEFIYACFPLLDVKATVEKYRRLYDNALDDNFLHNFRAIDQWANDKVPFPGLVFKKFIRDLYQENLLVKGEFTIDERPAKLENIRCPVQSITAEFDHVFPEKAALALMDHVRGPKEYHKIDAGHVTLIALFPQREVTYRLISDFLLA